jgi:ABC-type multidrug transport system ATPase subunit
LKDKTRVIVTHAVDFLDKVDRIIVMKKGKIMLNGSYSELLDHEYFKKMMKTVGKQNKKEEECSSEVDSEDTADTKDRKDHMSKNEKIVMKKESDDKVNITLNTYYEFFAYIKSGVPFMLLCMLISVV